MKKIKVQIFIVTLLSLAVIGFIIYCVNNAPVYSIGSSVSGNSVETTEDTESEDETVYTSGDITWDPYDMNQQIVYINVDEFDAGSLSRFLSTCAIWFAEDIQADCDALVTKILDNVPEDRVFIRVAPSDGKLILYVCEYNDFTKYRAEFELGE